MNILLESEERRCQDLSLKFYPYICPVAKDKVVFRSFLSVIEIAYALLKIVHVYLIVVHLRTWFTAFR